MIHISFDLWDTLIYSNPNFGKSRAEIIQQFILDKYNIWSSDTKQNIKLMKDRLDWMQTVTMEQISFKNGLIMILQSIGIDPRNVSSHDLYLLEQKLSQLVVKYPPNIIEGVEEMLIGLNRKGITTNILSNTNLIKGETLRTFLKDVGLSKYFNFMIFSDEHPYCKPNPVFFKMVHDNIHSDSEVYHVGDNPITDGSCTQNQMKFLLVENHNTPNLIKPFYAQSILTSQIH